MTAYDHAGRLDFGEDPFHPTTAGHWHWSASNVAEALPGVVTPLGWTVWGPAAEWARLGTFRAYGAITAAENSAVPTTPDDGVFALFYGRVATRLEWYCEVIDRFPGASGAAFAEQIFGFVPDGLAPRPTRRRYPFVAARFPLCVLRARKLATGTRDRSAGWWRRETTRAPDLTLADARAQLRDAIDHLAEALLNQGIIVLGPIQIAFESTKELAERCGVSPTELMSGWGGHEEAETVADLWACSRGTLALETFLERHGYHGPHEGEVGVVWREDPAPVLRLIERYRAMPDTDAPAAREERLRTRSAALEARCRRSGRWHQRLQACLVLALAHRLLPLRGVGKVAMVQSTDVARAAARRIGVLLAGADLIATADDVMFLTVDEALGTDPLPTTNEVSTRRDRHARYRAYQLPAAWQGVPDPIPVRAPATDHVTSDPIPDGALSGFGASPGTVEGPVRVILDPADADVEPGEILVAPTTDPGWASLMFAAAGLVVDIGGTLSHAAVVARELGIPCVLGTGDGTRLLHTGDLCRVDGEAGTVELLARASDRPQPQVGPLA